MTSKYVRKRISDEYKNAQKAIPNRDVEMAFVRSAQRGNRIAMTTLVHKYIPFLYKMANQISDSAYNLNTDELVNAAIFSFPKAVRTFDITRGVAFYTYLAAKAYNEMKKAAFDSLLVHKPENQLKAKDPNKVSTSMISIDSSVDGQTTILDRLSTQCDTTDVAAQRDMLKLLDGFMSTISNNEFEVLHRLYLRNPDHVTLRTVGNAMKLSHERIRQIKQSAINRIRQSPLYKESRNEK